MTDDPDELRYEQRSPREDAAITIDVLNEIEIHLRSLSALTFVGWLIVVLLALILWRIW